jgi:23S rRNA pseudouridine2605 synthase
VRINKFIAGCGIGSRRGSESIILSGRVKLNGATVRGLATDINSDDIVTIDGKPIFLQTEKVYIMLNKPTGVVTTASDPFGRKTVLDIVQTKVRIFPVGRLDYNTSGLLLLTNDGELAKKLTHPSSQIQKVYLAATDKFLSVKDLETLSSGVVIDGKKTAPAKFEFHNNKKNNIKITLHEGRNRQIRKMFESLGIRVQTLTRTNEGKLSLGNLKPGEWKYVKRSQII